MPTRVLSVLPVVAVLAGCVGNGGTGEGPKPVDDTGDAPADDTAGPLDDDGDGVPADEDCDDTDAGVGGPSTWYRDADADGYGDVATTAEGCEPPSGHVADATDCDDAAAGVNPGATEVCDPDDVDEDCDGLADDADGAVAPDSLSTFWPDSDGDGFGDPGGASVLACDAPSGAVTEDTDCDDAAAAVNPDAAEVCNGVDDDCDGATDDEDADVDRSTGGTWYTDGDGDGYGAAAVSACLQPSGTVADGTDCDDADGSVNPGAAEVAGDELDQDCDGAETCYLDADDDGYRPDATSTVASADLDCSDSGEATSAEPTGDCDDADATRSPGATEAVGDEVDQDCDGGETCYADADDDGYRPDATSTVASADADCADAGEALTSAPTTDCDDTDASVSPAATEVCNGGVDDDCSGDADDADSGLDTSTASVWYADTDSDGYGDASSTTLACLQPTGSVADDSDCDDADGAVSPGAVEVCGDGVDNDCTGVADDDCAVWAPEGQRSLGDLYTRMHDGYPWGGQLGSAVEMGDLDDDGVDDIIVGGQYWFTNGWVGVFQDQTFGELDDSDANIELEGNSGSLPTYLGSGLAVLDHDGDGDDDLVAGAYFQTDAYNTEGALFVLEGPVTAGGDYATTLADETLYGGGIARRIGRALRPVGDINADGFDDLVAGTYSSASNDGEAFLLLGPLTSTTSVETSSQAAFSSASGSGALLGYAVGGGDVTGDGVPDVVLGAPGEDSDAGRVYIYAGPVSGSITADATTADVTVYGDDPNDALGTHLDVVDDWDGDGTADLVTSAHSDDDGASNAGRIFVFAGPLSGAVTTSDATATIDGTTRNAAIGRTVRGAGDMNEDGLSDIAFGAASAVHLVYGGWSGAMDETDADFILDDLPGSRLPGWALAGGGDVDADGVDDLLIGDYRYQYRTSTVTSDGQVWLLPGVLDHLLGDAADLEVEGGDNSFGEGVAVTDLDGDGTGDLVAADVDAGEIALWHGPLTAAPLSGTQDLTLLGESVSDYAGTRMAGGRDLDGDGLEELLVSAPSNSDAARYAGKVYLVDGRASTGTVNLAGEPAWTGATSNDYLGREGLALLGDLDGGSGDLWWGATAIRAPLSGEGRVYLMEGTPASGPVSAAASVVVDGVESYQNLGQDLASGDLTGDGIEDLVLGAPSDLPDPGDVYVFIGPVSAGSWLATDADSVVTGAELRDRFGACVATGDTDGDGLADLLVGADAEDTTGGTDVGVMRLFRAPLATTVAATDAVASLTGRGDRAEMGARCDLPGDLDGDGTVDLTVASATGRWTSTALDHGAVGIAYGPLTGTLEPFWYLGDASDQLGHDLAAGDISGDGTVDLVFGAPSQWSTGTGRVFVHLGE